MALVMALAHLGVRPAAQPPHVRLCRLPGRPRRLLPRLALANVPAAPGCDPHRVAGGSPAGGAGAGAGAQGGGSAVRMGPGHRHGAEGHSLEEIPNPDRPAAPSRASTKAATRRLVWPIGFREESLAAWPKKGALTRELRARFLVAERS